MHLHYLHSSFSRALDRTCENKPSCRSKQKPKLSIYFNRNLVTLDNLNQFKQSLKNQILKNVSWKGVKCHIIKILTKIVPKQFSLGTEKIINLFPKCDCMGKYLSWCVWCDEVCCFNCEK